MHNEGIPHLERRQAVSALGTILGVWAHPDDEAFLSAGLMAAARAVGNRVVCVTATRGERGTPDPVRWPVERLARLRSWELRASLAVLGVEEHHWLGYVDGTIDEIPAEQGTGDIRRLIEKVQPDTVVTFGPEGMTGHADHRAVSAWATVARGQARPEARLLYATATPTFATEFADLNARYEVFPPGLPVTTAPTDLALRLHLDEETLDRKVAALRAQASQISGLYQAVGERRFRAWWREEAFVDADATEAVSTTWRGHPLTAPSAARRRRKPCIPPSMASAVPVTAPAAGLAR
jgi:LmbE family N-acetylglucosaminyl deacetylase